MSQRLRSPFEAHLCQDPDREGIRIQGPIPTDLAIPWLRACMAWGLAVLEYWQNHVELFKWPPRVDGIGSVRVRGQKQMKMNSGVGILAPEDT